MAEKTDTKKVEAEKVEEKTEKNAEPNGSEIKEDNVETRSDVNSEDKKIENPEVTKEDIEEEVDEMEKSAEEVSGEMIDKEVEREEGEEKEEKEKVVKELTRKEKFQKKLEEEEKERLASWKPKTKLGMEVKTGKIKNVDEIFASGRKILEPEIVDLLVNVQSDLISIGQSKGKFGGGKRRAWRQTQRKTNEGNIPTFSTMAVVGDRNGHVGIGEGKSKETLPARDKAIRKAKLNFFKVDRACSDFDCSCNELHSVPFKVTGKSGSVEVTLIPAAQGTGLVVGNELKKILGLAGIKDVYSRTTGKKRTTFNLIKACVDALKKTGRDKWKD